VGKEPSEPSEAAAEAESRAAPAAETPEAAAAEESRSAPEPNAPSDEPGGPDEGTEAAPPEEPVAGPQPRAGEPPTEEAEAEPGVEEPPVPPRSAWLWVAIVLVGAALIGLALGALLGGRQGGPLANQPGGNGRPTIVVGTVAAAPSAVANLASPSPSSVATAGASASTSGREYVVQPGDTLRSIAQDQYGDASQWPKIYQANRDLIGDDPDALVAGTTLQIPSP